MTTPIRHMNKDFAPAGATRAFLPIWLNRRTASLPLALLVSPASSASLHPSIWLNQRADSLLPSGSIVALHRCRLHCSFSPVSFTPPISATGGVGVPEPTSLVSPASSTPPYSATGRGGVPEPQAALRLRSPGPSDCARLFLKSLTFQGELVFSTL